MNPLIDSAQSKLLLEDIAEDLLTDGRVSRENERRLYDLLEQRGSIKWNGRNYLWQPDEWVEKGRAMMRTSQGSVDVSDPTPPWERIGALR